MKYVVIGGGVVGTAISRELAIKGSEVVVLEKEATAGLHASGRNSGVIHSGINQKPRTLKATLSVQGSKLLREYCLESGVPMRECGTILLANNTREIAQLRKLYDYALESRVPDVCIISQGELKEREPHARGLEGLFSPTGAIVDTKILMEKLVDDAQKKGVQFFWNTEVKKVHDNKVETTNKDYRFDYLVNCSGLHADTLAHTNGIGKSYSILPFREDYREVPAEVNGMIYHVPDLRFPFLGVHLTKTIEGEVIAGSTATLSFAGREGYEGGINRKFLSETANTTNFWLWAVRTLMSPSTLNQVMHNLRISRDPKKFIEDINKIYDGEIDVDHLKIYRSGIRPQLVDGMGRLVHDFLINDQLGNQLHLLNTVSPGLTASLAFAKHITKVYLNKK
ncbi:MAG: L-2-hydroxyglutarate oxidase [Nanoarchaeota archaeon]|mgnify:CR=1 FL=1